jgi:outer membrane protein insertion porin family
VPNPAYTKLPDSSNRLNSKIDIVPLKQMSDRVEGEFLFNAGQYGYDIGNTFTERDIFKQAAILQIKLNASILYNNSSSTVNPGGVENQDFTAGVSHSRVNMGCRILLFQPTTRFSSSKVWLNGKALSTP